MKVVNVRVIPNAKKKVRVKAPAVGGKANKTLIEVLAEFFKVKKTDIKIIACEKSRKKVIEVDIEDDSKC